MMSSDNELLGKFTMLLPIIGDYCEEHFNENVGLGRQ
jgi:hypothetical protein